MGRRCRIASIAMAALLWWGAAGGCGAAKLKQCNSDLAVCQAKPWGQLARTGQVTCYDAASAIVPCTGTGQDGELQKGLAPKYVDNGDGTVTDLNTGLMWEKKSDDGGIHDQHNSYTWADSFSVFIAALNGGGGLAGHTDWRLPNINELHSIANYGVTAFNSPKVNAVFDTSCTSGCTVTTCSCTRNDIYGYWSSTSDFQSPNRAWNLWFAGTIGDGPEPKTDQGYVRGVRGGP